MRYITSDTTIHVNVYSVRRVGECKPARSASKPIPFYNKRSERRIHCGSLRRFERRESGIIHHYRSRCQQRRLHERTLKIRAVGWHGECAPTGGTAESIPVHTQRREWRIHCRSLCRFERCEFGTIGDYRSRYQQRRLYARAP